MGEGGRRDMHGWKPELAKKGVRDVAEWRELLKENSATGRRLAQSAC